MALFTPLTDHDCTHIQGGVKLRGVGFVNGLRGGGNTIINNNGSHGSVAIGSTGISLISIGSIVF